MAEPNPDPSRPRRGRLRRWFTGLVGGAITDYFEHDSTTPAPDLPVTATANNVVTIFFPTPAKGDAYDFLVTADLCFCATGLLPVEWLIDKINARIPDLTAQIKAAARPTARKYPPFRPGAAEPVVAERVQAAVTTALVGVPDVDGVVLGCTVRVRVDVDPQVRELQRLAVAEQVKFDSRYDQSEQSAQRLGELREVWSKFITDGLPMWETPYALLMAQQPAQVAATLFKMRDHRKEEAAKLIDTIALVANGHERMDLLEFAMATDSALGKTYELLGIARPDSGATSLFSDPEDGESGS